VAPQSRQISVKTYPSKACADAAAQRSGVLLSSDGVTEDGEYFFFQVSTMADCLPLEPSFNASFEISKDQFSHW